MGRSRKQRSFPSGRADIHSFLPQLVDVGDENDGGLHRNPKQRQKTQDGGNAEGRVRELERNQRAHRFGHDHAQRDGDGKFEVSVERKQDHENQHHGQRANEVHLRFGLEKLAVFAAPCHPVALRQGHGLLHRRLAIAHRALQVAPLDAVLHADVARVIFAINKGRAISLGNVGELAERESAARRACPPADFRSHARCCGIAVACGPPDRTASPLE